MKIIQCLQAYREDGDDWIFDHYSIVLSHGTEVFKKQSQLELTIPQDIDAEQLGCPLLTAERLSGIFPVRTTSPPILFPSS